MSAQLPVFPEPSIVERMFNRALGGLVGAGLGPRDYYLLQVRGRKTGRVRSTPVNVIELRGAPGPSLAFTTGMHGGEYAGPLAMYHLAVGKRIREVSAAFLAALRRSAA